MSPGWWTLSLWQRVIHDKYSVSKQTHDPLKISVDIGLNYKDATWFQIKWQWFFIFSHLRFHLIHIIPALSLILVCFLLSLRPVPNPIFIRFYFLSIASPPFYPRCSCFPYLYHTFTTCQEDQGLCGFCPVLGAVQLNICEAVTGFGFVLVKQSSPIVRKWTFFWFKLSMRQRCT